MPGLETFHDWSSSIGVSKCTHTQIMLKLSLKRQNVGTKTKCRHKDKLLEPGEFTH